MTEKMTEKQLEDMADQFLAQHEKTPEPKEKKSKGGKLDDKTIATLPAAALIQSHEKLKDLLVRAKKKGKINTTELGDLMDELELNNEQMDQVPMTVDYASVVIGPMPEAAHQDEE